MNGVVGAILNELHNSFFDLVPSYVNTVLHREISSVAKPHQRQGIATRMMNFSLSPEKLQPLKVIRLTDWKDSQGNQLLQPDDGTEEAVLNWKPVEELIL
ncbi:hypothetical protein TELCIR_07805 [Teladorsagia circumcincta]|uniref:Uncharacterized protein n=1 Tax=Teladorsagia circumcincta TaxID=45464 RepID=A0A2G9UJM4_TELCI|nr:hypothetical protein TELCIR_07805 [Teladorsagia circumcincta]